LSVKVKFSRPERSKAAQFFDWEQYCDGDTHHLKRGEDWFGDRIDSARSAGQQWAARQGGSDLEGMKTATAIVDADTFSFRITKGLPAWLKPEALALQQLRQDGKQTEFEDKIAGVKFRLDREREQRRAAAGYGKPEGAKHNPDPTLARRRKLAQQREEAEAQKPAPFDPLKERSDRLSDQDPRDVLAQSRPMARRRRV
jgi:hypothetical protein